MPRKKKISRKDMTRKEAFKAATFGGYLNVDLDQDDRETFEVWCKSAEVNTFSAIDLMLELGIDFKIYMNWKEGTVVVQMLMITEPDFKIWTISSYHGTCEEALKIALFKHLVLLDEDWHKEIAGIGDRPFYG